MSNYILFSCVGSTDPIRDNYDGPMLHIIRHYRPHTVYVFLSQEMGLREKKDKRYSQGINLLSKQLNHPVGIRLIFSDIENPHDFDAFIGIFSKHLEGITQEFPQDKILLNISSGTPQMMSTLCLEAIVSSKPLIPVQVVTPAARANQSKVGGREFDIEWEFHNNLDNEPDAPNRCVFPDILSFKRTLAKGQVQALLKKYNYEEAAQILRGFGAEEESVVMRLLAFANGKKSLSQAIENSVFNGIKKLVAYPEMDKECQKVCEYFNVIKLLQKTGHLTDFVLRLNPLVTELQSLFLENCLNFRLECITEKQQRFNKSHNSRAVVEILVKRDKIRAYDRRLLEYVDDCFNGEYRDGSYINIKFQNCLISYYLKDATDNVNSFADLFKNLENLNQEHRNIAAHNLYGVLEEDIRDKAGMTSAKIVSELERLIKFIFKTRCKEEIFNIFDSINLKILEELERSL